METTLSLIRPADPDAILGAAAALMPPTDWAMTRALLPTIGLAKARVDLGAATLGCGTMLQSIACRYALDDGSAALTVAVPRGLVDMLCSLRFGGDRKSVV